MDGGEAIRGLLQGGKGFGGQYGGEAIRGLTPRERQELQGLGVDTSGTMIIPTMGKVITDYRAAKALGPQELAVWKAQQRRKLRDKLFFRR